MIKARDWEALSEEAKLSIWTDFVRNRSEEIRELLIEGNANLACSIASKFMNRGEPLDDLIGVAKIGLINAVDRFEPDKGTKFSTFATPTIVGEIRRHFRDRCWSLKVPRRVWEAYIRTKRREEKLTQELGHDATLEELSSDMNVPVDDVSAVLQTGNAYAALSLETIVSNSPDQGTCTLVEMINDDSPSMDDALSYDDLNRAFGKLSPEEQSVVRMYHLNELSQDDIAKVIHKSQMEVSRILGRAKRKLCETLEIPFTATSTKKKKKDLSMAGTAN